MKNINTILKKNNWLLAMLLFSMTMSYAQTVSVPVGCIVVVAGTGGTIGPNPTGRVGEGGVVSMPDPSGGGTFTFNPPSGATTITWRLRGDLSNSTATPFYGAPTQPANGLTANIITYNKNFRTSEGVAPSVSSLARSKGQVRVSYDQTGCGKFITFDVFKTYASNVPVIVGPDCILPNRFYTFSVDQIASDNADDAIGFDKYYWSDLPPFVSTSIYYSADGSSITFKTPTTLSGSSWNIKCSYGRANPWDNGIAPAAAGTPTTFVTKPIGSAPQEPVYNLSTPASLVLSATPGCVATGLSSFTVNYPAPPLGTTYVWSAPNTTWNIATTATSAQFSNIANNSGSILLTVENSCGDPVEFLYQIRRTFTAAVTITPTTSNCLAPTVASSFSLGPNASVNVTNWTVTPAPALGSFSFNINTPTTTATVNTSANITPGTYSLTATSSSCGGSVSIPIYVRRPAPVFTLSSPTCVVRGSTPVNTIQVDTSVLGTPTTGYVWTLPVGSGWTISAGATTSTPTFVPNGTTGGPIIVSVRLTGPGGCDSATATKSISYIYITTSPDPNFPGCDQYNLIGSGCYTGTPVWTIGGAAPNGTTAFTNPFSTSLFICGSGTPPPPGTVCATVTIGGVPQIVCATAAGFHGLLKQGNPDNVPSKEIIEGVTVYPNPTNGDFVIKVNHMDNQGSATLMDATGKRIATYVLHKGDNDIKNEGIAKGNYFVMLDIDGKQEARKIIIK